jgi:hypothetical protein
VKTKPRASKTLTPSLTSRPTTAATTATATIVNLTERPNVAPPLERALYQFIQELRNELASTQTQAQALQSQVAALQSELASLKTRYEAHSHTYTRTVTGSGGNLWFDLGSLKHYIDEDKEKFDNWGVYFREGGSTGNAPEELTGLPNK